MNNDVINGVLIVDSEKFEFKYKNGFLDVSVDYVGDKWQLLCEKEVLSGYTENGYDISFFGCICLRSRSPHKIRQHQVDYFVISNKSNAVFDFKFNKITFYSDAINAFCFSNFSQDNKVWSSICDGKECKETTCANEEHQYNTKIVEHIVSIQISICKHKTIKANYDIQNSQSNISFIF